MIYECQCGRAYPSSQQVLDCMNRDHYPPKETPMMLSEQILAELANLPSYGYSDEMREAVMEARKIVAKLQTFIRTPEWSVSMLEDIAALVSTELPDFEPDHPLAWKPH